MLYKGNYKNSDKYIAEARFLAAFCRNGTLDLILKGFTEGTEESLCFSYPPLPLLSLF